MATSIGKVGAWQWGGDQGEEEEKEQRYVLHTSEKEVLKRHQKAEIPELPPVLTIEVVQMGRDGFEGWGRAEVDSPSRGKESRRNK